MFFLPCQVYGMKVMTRWYLIHSHSIVTWYRCVKVNVPPYCRQRNIQVVRVYGHTKCFIWHIVLGWYDYCVADMCQSKYLIHHLCVIWSADLRARYIPPLMTKLFYDHDMTGSLESATSGIKSNIQYHKSDLLIFVIHKHPIPWRKLWQTVNIGK